MSLLDPRTAAYWPIDEHHDSVLPSDAAGNLADLAVPGTGGLTRPEVIGGTPGGFGRDFVRSGLTGLYVTDSGGKLRLTRGLAIVAMLRLDVEALANGNLCDLVQRGRGGGSDPIAFRLRFNIVNAATRRVSVVLNWQTAAGGDVAASSVEFTWPASSYLLIAATREVVGGQFATRYQINGESFSAGTQALDVGGNSSADVSVGMGMNGAAYQNHLDGVLDSLHILSESVSVEEFAWTWERITKYIPEASEAIRRLQVRGVYSKDPTSRIQRELRVEGELAGHAKALSARLRDYGLPDRAWGDVLAKWETITAHSPKPGDDLETRRNRVLGFLGTQRGANPEDIKAVLEEVFGLDAADIQILEFTNEYSQAFGATPTDALVVAGNVTFAVSGGVLNADAAGSSDIRYGGILDPRAGLYLWPLSSGVDAIASAKVTVNNIHPDAIAGIVLGSRLADEWVWIGVVQTDDAPIANVLVWLRYQAGVLDTGWTVIDASLDLSPAFLRVHYKTDGTIDVRVGASDAAAKAAAPVNIDPGIGVPDWAGLSAAAPQGNDSVSIDAAFDDFFTYTPEGDQRFYWYAYRDPGLGGTYDLEGARAIVKRVKPAHTEASACSALVAICDDVNNPCDTTPCG